MSKTPIEILPHKEEALIEQAKAGSWAGEGSTSEVITVALALDRPERLPTPYTTEQAAWQRLNVRQQAIVRRHRPSFSFSP